MWTGALHADLGAALLGSATLVRAGGGRPERPWLGAPAGPARWKERDAGSVRVGTLVQRVVRPAESAVVVPAVDQAVGE